MPRGEIDRRPHEIGMGRALIEDALFPMNGMSSVNRMLRGLACSFGGGEKEAKETEELCALGKSVRPS
jgi:hypothetical protein